MFERFTKAAREVVRLAELEARRLGADAVGPEHLLVATVEQMGSWGSWPFVGPSSFTVRSGSELPEPVTADRIRSLLQQDPDAEALATLGISLAEVRRRAEEAFGPDAWEPPAARRRTPFTKEAKQVLELALREALALASREIRREHILLALLRVERPRAIVRELGAAPDDAYERLRASLSQLARLATR